MGSRHLPGDIIEAILLKLPVKCIIRFQTVSKSWFHLINSSRFISKHEIESNELLFFMFFTVPRKLPRNSWMLATGNREIDDECDRAKNEAVYVLSGFHFELLLLPSFVQYLEGVRNWYVAGDCNGVLCLTNDVNVMLVNPSRKEAKTLPNFVLPEVGNHPGYWFCNLVGIGFDTTITDFTVVAVLCFKSLHNGVLQRRVDLYNLKSNGWRELNVYSFPKFVDFSSNASIFFNGVIHWCGRLEALSWGILTYNMADNRFSQLELPQGWYENEKEWASFRLFVLSQESLAFVSYTESGFVNVWIMNEHGGLEATWTKMYSTRPLTLLDQPLSIWNKHTFIYKTTDGKIILYDLINHNSSVFCDDVSQFRLDDPRFEICKQFGICRPCLVSINT